MRTSCGTVTKAKSHRWHKCWHQVGAAWGILHDQEVLSPSCRKPLCSTRQPGGHAGHSPVQHNVQSFSHQNHAIPHLHPHTTYPSRDIIIAHCVNNRGFSSSLYKIRQTTHGLFKVNDSLNTSTSARLPISGCSLISAYCIMSQSSSKKTQPKTTKKKTLPPPSKKKKNTKQTTPKHYTGFTNCLCVTGNEPYSHYGFTVKGMTVMTNKRGFNYNSTKVRGSMLQFFVRQILTEISGISEPGKH